MSAYTEKWCVYRAGGYDGLAAVGLKKVREALRHLTYRTELNPSAKDHLMSAHESEADARAALAGLVRADEVSAWQRVASFEAELRRVTDRLAEARARAEAATRAVEGL